MRKITALVLVAALLLLCCACSRKSESEGNETVIRYESNGAYYTQDGAEHTMELNFARLVPAESEITLTDGEATLVQFRLSVAVSKISIAARGLEENVPYTVLVDGVAQRHGKDVESFEGVTLEPEQPTITEPEQPTIPTEIRGQETEPATEGKFGLSLEQPPTIAEEGLVLDSITGGASNIPSGGELPSQSFTPGKEQSTPDTLNTEVTPTRNMTRFVLSGKLTSFRDVQDAT